MNNEVLAIIRDECQKLDKRLAYIGITSLCTADHNVFVGGILIKLQITCIDGTRRYFSYVFHDEPLSRIELRSRIRYMLRQLSYRILDEAVEA